MKPDESGFVSEYAVVRSLYVRRRNCLLLWADFAPLFVGYYLHQMQHAMHPSQEHAALFKDLMAFFTLFIVSRPWNEHHAWTVNVKTPVSVNIFVAGSSLTEDVVGRTFTENVRETDTTMLYAQNICRERDTHTSVVPITSEDAAGWVEEYFRQSEQRQARAFRGQEDDLYYLVVAEPDADFDWLSELSVDDVVHAEENEETKLLETRRFTFRCGCSAEKIAPVLRSMQKDFADELSEQGQLEVSCPRCGVKYTITGEMITGSDTAPDAC